MENINLAQELLSFETDFLFFQAHINNLREKYLNKFIAIKDKQVIGSALSIEELRTELGSKGIDLSIVVVEFVPEEEAFMVL